MTFFFSSAISLAFQDRQSCEEKSSDHMFTSHMQCACMQPVAFGHQLPMHVPEHDYLSTYLRIYHACEHASMRASMHESMGATILSPGTLSFSTKLICETDCGMVVLSVPARQGLARGRWIQASSPTLLTSRHGRVAIRACTS